MRYFYKICIITEAMKAATIVTLKKELETLDAEHLKSLCLRLARFKIENKELLGGDVAIQFFIFKSKLR